MTVKFFEEDELAENEEDWSDPGYYFSLPRNWFGPYASRQDAEKALSITMNAAIQTLPREPEQELLK